MELVEFLLARIGEDERAAQAEWDWMIERHGPDFWTTGEGAPFDGEWRYETDRDASLHASPRRVLAECAAKRRIVEMAQPDLIGVLAALALPYADHSDYDPAWNPEATQ